MCIISHKYDEPWRMPRLAIWRSFHHGSHAAPQVAILLEVVTELITHMLALPIAVFWVLFFVAVVVVLPSLEKDELPMPSASGLAAIVQIFCTELGLRCDFRKYIVRVFPSGHPVVTSNFDAARDRRQG